MTLAKHLEDATARLREASVRIDEARALPANADSVRRWLEALTDFCAALADIQTYANESVHEKLHELAARAGVSKFPS
jgi:hypothetical protein